MSRIFSFVIIKMQCFNVCKIGLHTVKNSLTHLEEQFEKENLYAEKLSLLRSGPESFFIRLL